MMGKFQQLFIIVVTLFVFSEVQAAEEIIERSLDHLLVRNRDGKVVYVDIKRIDGKEFRSVNWVKTEEAEARYLAKKINETRVKHANSGMFSSAKVPVAITGSVPRQTVLKNLLTKAVAGGRIVAGVGSGPVGWAITGASVATTAYDLVSPTLAGHGYVYDPKYNHFVAEDMHVYCVAFAGLCTDQQRQETVFNTQAVYADLKNPTPEMLKEKLCKQIKIEHLGFDRGVKASIVDWRWNEEGNYCEVQTQMLESYGYSRAGSKEWRKSRWLEKVPKIKQPITQAEFDKIIGPSADASPRQYVNATADEKGIVPGVTVSPNVTVPNGTVVTIGPYTDSDGQPKQVTVTFTTTNGETTVSVQVTPRPDLSPNSSAAPSTSSRTNGQSSPSGSPNSDGQTAPQTSGQTGSQTGSQIGAQTDGQSSNQNNPKTDAEPDKKDKEDEKSQDGGLLCNIFPDILACDKQPEPEEPDLKIPEETINLNFTPDTSFAENGQCPAPVNFQALGGTYSISLQPACDLAALMRPFIIAMAWLVASFFVVRVVRENA